MLAGTIGVLTLAVLYAVFFLVPPAEGLGNYVRIAFFHIPCAWVSVIAFFCAAYWGMRYLKTRELRFDDKSARGAGQCSRSLHGGHTGTGTRGRRRSSFCSSSTGHM